MGREASKARQSRADAPRDVAIIIRCTEGDRATLRRLAREASTDDRTVSMSDVVRGWIDRATTKASE